MTNGLIFKVFAFVVNIILFIVLTFIRTLNFVCILILDVINLI